MKFKTKIISLIYFQDLRLQQHPDTLNILYI